MIRYDLIVAGAGAAGMMAAITAARAGKHVLLIEKLPKIGAKLGATGGGRCNLTNTLDNDTFMARFGKQGRFMTTALKALDHEALRWFFAEIGVATDAPDGFRVFPVGHQSGSIIDALEKEMARLGVQVRCGEKVEALLMEEGRAGGVRTSGGEYHAHTVVIATGGLGYPQLGAEGDGLKLAREAGHTVTACYPAMMPLKTRETWVARCRADTIPKATIRIDMKKAKGLHATGDLIFTKDGIRGPVVLDFAREITPLLEANGEVPLLVSMTDLDENAVLEHFKSHPQLSAGESLAKILPQSVADALINESGGDPALGFAKLSGAVRDKLIKRVTRTPLTVVGHGGFKQAMITRGGVKLKEIDPETMQSRILPGLFFCGEVMDLDGPCGGYNLQWSFSSGHLAGLSIIGET